MLKNVRSRLSFMGIAIAFLIFCSPSFLRSENVTKGNIIGFVYDEEGTTPLEGAVVEFKNIYSGAVYKSSRSDSLGVFKIEGMERGMYIYGVKTAQGDFNSDGTIGVRIRENKTAKLSISLAPYEERVAAEIKKVYEEQKVAGKALVGRAVDYNPDTHTADVLITKGMLRLDDRIYAKGEVTDFYQDVNALRSESSSVASIFAGRIASFTVKKKVEIGDLIYSIFKSDILPIFSSPSGDASIVAGSSEIFSGFTLLGDVPVAPSNYKQTGWYQNCNSDKYYQLEQMCQQMCKLYPQLLLPWCIIE